MLSWDEAVKDLPDDPEIVAELERTKRELRGEVEPVKFVYVPRETHEEPRKWRFENE